MNTPNQEYKHDQIWYASFLRFSYPRADVNVFWRSMSQIAICTKCGSNKNVYQSPNCWNRINEAVHNFCLQCLFENSNTRLHLIEAVIACPVCDEGLFNFIHCISNKKTSFDSMYFEFECWARFQILGTHNAVVENINQLLRSHLMGYVNSNFSFDRKVGIDYYSNLKRGLTYRPNILQDYENLRFVEFDLFNWVNFAKCANCYTEINLHQCYDKTECHHICCLECFFRSSWNNQGENVLCPNCRSYCGGTLECYETKALVQREPNFTCWQYALRYDDVNIALDKMRKEIFKSDALYLAIKRFEKQPESFTIFKDLRNKSAYRF